MLESKIGIAIFECGSGNTMQIEFPTVIEADSHMNYGISFMPFMNKGFYFLREEDFLEYSEGINEVERGFVKYLYEIRKANRKGEKLEYHTFSGPDRLTKRERVFIAGKIFPVLSISYSGDDIDCSSSKIEVRTVSFYELRLLFGEMFGEYKVFSTEYISIDNDNIRIYLPKSSAININYPKLLVDFLSNGNITKDVATHGEFPDMETYTLATGNYFLADGCWVTEDREDKKDTWKEACMYIVENKLQGVLAPFGQIADFYSFLDDKITNDTKHKIRWLKGAKKLVNSLKIMDGGFSMIANDVELILNELNVGICDFAITQFYELFYGKYKNAPLDTLQKAYEFDLQFVQYEQGVVAVPIYSKTSKTTIAKYQDMADQDAKGIHGLGGWFMDEVWGDRIIPEFDDPWEGDVTDAQFRIDLPMLMLWPDRHKPKGINFADKVDSEGYLLEKYKKIIKKYEAK